MVHNKYWEGGKIHYLMHLFHIFEIKPCFLSNLQKFIINFTKTRLMFSASIEHEYISYSVIIFRITILQYNYKQLLFKV